MISAAFSRLPLLGGIMLAGCATLAPSTPPTEPASYQPHRQSVASIQSFEMRGRIGVLTEKKGFSGLIRWHHHTDGDDIKLYSPLGTQLGQINADADGVTLTTSDQKSHHAADTETLTEQTLGWSLPLSGLSDWALGRPAAGDAEILAWDESGHISRLRQDGWDIQYPQYMEANSRQLPAKIVLKSTKLDIRLVVETWQTATE